MDEDRLAGEVAVAEPKRLTIGARAERLVLAFAPFIGAPAGVEIAAEKQYEAAVELGVGVAGFERDGAIERRERLVGPIELDKHAAKTVPGLDVIGHKPSVSR